MAVRVGGVRGCAALLYTVYTVLLVKMVLLNIIAEALYLRMDEMEERCGSNNNSRLQYKNMQILCRTTSQ